MILTKWAEVVLCWGRKLNIGDEEYNYSSVADLVESNFFLRLAYYINKNSKGQYGGSLETNKDAVLYLESRFPNLGPNLDLQDDDDALFVATVFMLESCIYNHQHSLQNQICSLDEEYQAAIKNLLEKFIDVPHSHVSRELVFSHLVAICQNRDSLPSTPVSCISRSVKGSSSSRRSSRIKKLRSEISFLTTTQTELQEELDVANDKISKLENILNKKDVEISTLKLKIQSPIKVASPKYSRPTVCNKCTLKEAKIEKCEVELIQLKDDVAILQQTKADLKKQLMSAEGEIMASQEELIQSQSQISELKSQIVKLSSELDERIYEEHLAANRRESLNSRGRFSLENYAQITNLGQEVVDLQLQEMQSFNIQQENEILKLNQEVMIKESDNAAMKHQLQEKHDEVVKLLRDISDREEELSKYKNETASVISELEGSILSHNQEISLLREKIEEELKNQHSLQEIIIQKEAEIADFGTTISSLNQEIHLQKDKLEAELEAQTCLKEEIVLKESELAQHKCQIAAMTADFEEAISLLNKESVLLNEKLIEEQKSHNCLKKEIKQMEKEIAKQIDKITTVTSEFEATISSLNNDNLALKENLEAEQKNLKTLDANIKKKEKIIAKQKDKIAGVTSDFEATILSLNKENALLNENIENQNTLIAALVLKEQELSKQKEELSAVISNLKLTNSSLNQDISSLNVELEKEMESKMNLKEELGLKEKTLSKLSEEIATVTSDFEANISSLNKENCSLKKQHEAEIENQKSLQAEIMGKEQELIKLKVENAAVASNLQSTIASLNHEISLLNGKLEEELKNQSALQLEIMQREQELVKLKDEIANVTSELESIKSSLEEEVSSLKTKLEGEIEIQACLKDQIEQKEEQLSKQKEEIVTVSSDFEATISSLNVENASLQNQLEAKLEIVKSLQAEIVRKDQELLKLKDDIAAVVSDLESINSSLNDEIASLKGKCEEELKIRACLEDQIGQKEEQISTQKNENKAIIFDLNATISSVNNENALLKNQLEHQRSLEAEIMLKEQELTNQRDENSAVTSELKAIVSSLNQEISSMKEKLEVELETRAYLKEEMIQKERELVELKDQIATVTSDHGVTIKLLNLEISSLKDKLEGELETQASLRKEIQLNEQQLLLQKEENVALTTDFEATITSLNMKNALLKDRLENQKSLQEEIVKKDKELSKIKDKMAAAVSALESTNLSLKSEISLLKNQLDVEHDNKNSLEAEVVQKTQELAKLSDKVAAVTSELESTKLSLNQEITSLKGKLESEFDIQTCLKVKIEQNEQQLSKEKEELAGVISNFEATISALNMDNAVLKEQLATELENQKTLQAEIDEKEQQLSKLKGEIIAVTSNLEATISSANKENALLNEQLAVELENKKSLEADIDLKVQELDNQRDESVGVISDLKSTISSLNHKITLLEENLEAEKKNHNSLQAEINTNEKELAKVKENMAGVISQLESANSSLCQEICFLKAQLGGEREIQSCLRKEIEEKEQQFFKQREELAAATSNLEETISSAIMENSRLKEQLAAELENQKSLQIQVEQKEQQLSNKQVEIVAATSAFEATISSLNKEIGLVNKLLAGELENKESLEAQILKKERELVKLGNESAAVTSDLKSSISSLNHEIILLKDNLQEKHENQNSLLAEIDSREQELAKLKDKMAEVTSELESANISLSQEIASLQAKLDGELKIQTCLNKEIDEKEQQFSKQIEELVAVNTNFEASISALNMENNMLKEQLRTELENQKFLQVQVEQQEQQLSNKQKEIIAVISDFKATISSLNEEIALTNKQLADEQATQKSLEALLIEKEREVTKKEDENASVISDLKSTISSLNREIVVLKDSLQEKHENQNSLLAEMNQKDQILTKLNDQIAALTIELESTVSSFNQEISSLKEKVVEDLEIQSCLKREVVQNEEELVKKREEFVNVTSNLEAAISSLKHELSSIEQKLGEELKAKTCLKDEILQKEQALEKLNDEIAAVTSDLKATISALNQNIAKLEEKQNSLQAEIVQKDSELANQKVETDVVTSNFETTISALNQEIHSLKEKLEAELETKTCLEEKIVLKEGELSKQMEQITALASDSDSRFSSLNNEISSLKTKLEEQLVTEKSLKKDLVEKENKLVKQIEDFARVSKKQELQTEEILVLTSELHILKRDVEHDKKVYMNICEVNEELKQRNCKLESEITLKSKEIELLMLQIFNKSEDLTGLRTEMGSLVSEMKVMKNQLSEAHSRMGDFQNLKDNENLKEREILALKTELEHKTNSISELEAIVDNLQKSGEELKTQVQDLNSILEHERAEVEVVKLSNNEKVSKLMNKISEQDQIIEDLKLNQDETSELKLELSSLKEKLRDHAAEYSNTVQNLKDDKSKLQQLIEEQAYEMKITVDKLKNLSTDIEAKNECLNKLQSQLNTLNQQNWDVEKNLSAKTSDIEKYKVENEMLKESLLNSNQMNVTLEKEVKSLLKAKIEDKETYSTHFESIHKENLSLKVKLDKMESYVTGVSDSLRIEYEQKLAKLKEKMKKIYTEKLEEVGVDAETYKNEIKKYKDRIYLAEQKNRDLSDQLLIAQEEKRTLLSSSRMFAVPQLPQTPSSRSVDLNSPVYKSHSMGNLMDLKKGIDNFGHDISFGEHLGGRRSSVRGLPRGIGKMFLSTGKVFPAAEEDGEVFDNRCLSDLQAGVCRVANSTDRMSILQQRNSMCLPHLKSSYPVETQFLGPELFRENDIKFDRLAVDAEPRKNKQTCYKKPGPPTPTKSAAQMIKTERTIGSSTPSSQTQKVEEKRELKPKNVAKPASWTIPATPKAKKSTPSKIRSFLSRRKENASP